MNQEAPNNKVVSKPELTESSTEDESTISRRDFLIRGAGALGGVAAASVMPEKAHAENSNEVDPKLKEFAENLIASVTATLEANDGIEVTKEINKDIIEYLSGFISSDNKHEDGELVETAIAGEYVALYKLERIAKTVDFYQRVYRLHGGR